MIWVRIVSARVGSWVSLSDLKTTHSNIIIIIIIPSVGIFPRDLRKKNYYPRRARSALGVDTVLTLDVCLYVCMFVCLYVSALERKRLIGMT